MHIGSAIRQTREQLGLKLEAVAMEAGFDAGNLSRIETGKQKPSITRLESIARAMKVRVADLYALVEPLPIPGMTPSLREGDIAPYHDDLQTLRRSYSALDPRRRKLVYEFVKLLNRMQKEESAAHEEQAPHLGTDFQPAARPPRAK
ncbi:hypothetical protein GCM10023144_39850 [Pigmentiphaga soli]|uniref:HTH cro/C1-type domain-containing protein n=1 Tax=Pigmentiphaga soli TaxID=1007095 RepID=A0ABP8HJR3_9BURK